VDYLLAHLHRMIIVESKSVTTEVRVNEHGEWCRMVHGRPRGMASPIEQARRQWEFFRSVLNAHKESLLARILGLQGTFTAMPLEVLVAISDDGIIRRARGHELPEVLKADQVSERIREMLQEHRRVNSLFSFNFKKAGYELSREEQGRVVALLLQRHQPFERGSPPAEAGSRPTNVTTAASIHISVEPSRHAVARGAVASRDATLSEPPDQLTCRACRSRALSVECGRYGYYLKCDECDGNTPIRAACANCGERARIRKSGREYFADCTPRGTSAPYFVSAG
jgi:hypothetical protein